MNKTIPQSKIKSVLLLHELGVMNIRGTARTLKIARNTLKRYTMLFDHLKTEAPHDEDLIGACLNYIKKRHDSTQREHPLFKLFPSVVENICNNCSNRLIEWKNYRLQDSDGYGYTQFTSKLAEWCKTNQITIPKGRLGIKFVSNDDMDVLLKWRRSSNKGNWERATALLETLKGTPISIISTKIERGRRKVKKWIKLYETGGLKALERKAKKLNEKMRRLIDEKKANLIKLIHESPNLHGINRASWSLKMLAKAYKNCYKTSLSMSSISEYLRSEGYRFRKARKTLTSPDPDYREKLKKITGILSTLGEREKFFSVDEFGPFAVKIQGGRALVKKGEVRTYPQMQVSKGKLICTAALELSQNQVTHFYSEKKNTAEMIRLVETLLEKYKTEERIYFSWDAASWHASRALYKRIDELNSLDFRRNSKTPLIELAPLPACAQFLNVIESVFSGMARAIIHNSNYNSVKECKTAIDLYFKERNQYFLKNPKRAGNKIWGKERHTPVFNETKNFKDPKWR